MMRSELGRMRAEDLMFPDFKIEKQALIPLY